MKVEQVRSARAANVISINAFKRKGIFHASAPFVLLIGMSQQAFRNHAYFGCARISTRKKSCDSVKVDICNMCSACKFSYIFDMKLGNIR